jgi:hypothetical protein
MEVLLVEDLTLNLSKKVRVLGFLATPFSKIRSKKSGFFVRNHM